MEESTVYTAQTHAQRPRVNELGGGHGQGAGRIPRGIGGQYDGSRLLAETGELMQTG